MKKIVSFVLAIMFLVCSSSLVFASDSETAIPPVSSSGAGPIQRIHKSGIKVVVTNSNSKIIHDNNWNEEDVTVIFESTSAGIDEIYLLLERDAEDENGEPITAQSDRALVVGDSYTFANVPKGGYTVYAISTSGRSGVCYFTVSDKI